MVHVLAHLYLTLPKMRRVRALAFFTLLILNYEFDHECLLEQSAIHDFFLHCDLDLESSRVGLGPDEAGVNHLNALQSLDMLEAQREQLGRLELARHPWRLSVSVALAAVMQLN